MARQDFLFIVILTKAGGRYIIIESISALEVAADMMNTRRLLCVLAAAGSLSASALLAADGPPSSSKPHVQRGRVILLESELKGARSEQGPLVIYRFKMSGSTSFKEIVVGSEKTKQFLTGLLQLLLPDNLLGNTTKDPQNLTPIKLMTAAEYIANQRGDGKKERGDKMLEDLKSHEAVVLSYVNMDTVEKDDAL
jgi:hypothetical protein